MTKLSVNINKIATIRNARGGTVPNVVESAKRIQEFGAHGITVHPRPDERHITYQDVKDIAPTIKTEFNIEGYPNRDWLDLVIKTKPTQATLVPDPPGVLTSNAGWDTIEHADFLKEVLNELSSNGIRTSIFIGCEKELIEKAKEVGSDRIELYTEPFADRFGSDKHESVKAFSSASKTAHDVGLGVNAGHDLNLENLRFFKDSLPHLDEVSIGHALISESLYKGLHSTIKSYLDILK